MLETAQVQEEYIGGTKLSVYIMVNEDDEKFLRRAINSIAPIADELLIGFETLEQIDSFSYVHPDTVIKTYHLPWTGSFSEMRNTMIDKCKYEWIFGMDVDELIAFPKALKEWMKNSTADALLILRLNFPDGEFLYDHHPDLCSRIHRNKKSIRFKRIVHEQLTGYETKEIVKKAFLVHVKSRERLDEEEERYPKLLEQERKEMDDL